MDPQQQRQQHAIDGMILRGGTSNGFFTHPDSLPKQNRDQAVLELFGTPDPIQIDGLGGSHTHTSKLMLVDPSDQDSVDLSYQYGQVGITTPTVDWNGNCGNLVSAIGMFGMLNGWVEPEEPVTTVRIYSHNTDSIIEQDVPTVEGEPTVYGTYSIDGVPGTGARIKSRYLKPAGGILGELLPTGTAVNTLSVDGDSYTVSIVDATNVTVFLKAGEFGLSGIETPEELVEMDGFLDRIEQIRGAACVELGLVDNPTEAIEQRPTMPFIALISEPQSYEATTGESIDESEVTVTARMISTQRPHHAYAMTGAMCLAAATKIPDTIPNEMAVSRSKERVTIGHPKGITTIGVAADTTGADTTIEHVSVDRTARPLMTGTAFYRQFDKIQ